MRISSQHSIDLAQRLLDAHNGNWDDVRKASHRRADGVFVVRLGDDEADRERRAPAPIRAKPAAH